MAFRTVKFVSAISAGLVVSTPFATTTMMAAEAAEECLTKPKEVTPPGQHWFYAVDRTSKRHCWFLGSQTRASSHAAISKRARRGAIVASHKSEPTMTRATADAYAEFFALPQGRSESAPQVSQQTLVETDYPKGAETQRQAETPPQPDIVVTESPQSLVASRWPDPADVPSAAVEPPPPSFAVAAVTPDEKLDPGPADLTPKAAPVIPTSVETPSKGTPDSLETLLLATLGAIVLTGFAGSSVFLLARLRRPPQSRASLAREPEWPPELANHTRLPRWLDPPVADPTRYPYRAHEAEF